MHTESSLNFNTFTAANQSIAFQLKRGKSGQQRAAYFLTGRVATSDGCNTASATENKLPWLAKEKVKR